jgi:hypothetical protein
VAVQAIASVLGLFGLLALLLAASRLVAARRLAALGYALQAAVLLAAAAVAWMIAADLGSYEHRRDDRPVADLYFEQVGERHYRATLTRLPGGRMQVFELEGDAWRLDVRLLDFAGWARAIGLPASYRLDRLVAIERGDADSGGAETTGFALGGHDGLDLWEQSRQTDRWRKLIEAGYAQSSVLPMTSKARFELLIAEGRIDAHAANFAAEPAEPAAR